MVKFATGNSFNNILWAAFSYKSILHSFYVLPVCVCIILDESNLKKSC